MQVGLTDIPSEESFDYWPSTCFVSQNWFWYQNLYQSWEKWNHRNAREYGIYSQDLTSSSCWSYLSELCVAVASVSLVFGQKSAGQEGRMSGNFGRAGAHRKQWGWADLYTDSSLLSFQSWGCWGLEEEPDPLPVLNTSWPGNWLSSRRGPIGAAVKGAGLSYSQQGAPAA